jgi:hypothetical protein
LEQPLWKAWGKTEFWLRLTELVGHTICVLLFCYWLAEETELVHYETSCPGELPCYSTSTATLDEQPLWMVVLGGVVVVWSVRYLLEQAGDVILLYRAARREQKRAMLVALFEQYTTTPTVDHAGSLLERHTFKALKAAVVTRESTIAFLQEKEEALLDKVFDTEITRETLVAFYEKHDPEQVEEVDEILKDMSVEQIKAFCQNMYGAAPESTVIPRAEGGGSTAATDTTEDATKQTKEAATAPYWHDYARAAMVAAKSPFQWDDLVANILTLVVVGMAWSGVTLNLFGHDISVNLVCAMTVFALFVRLADQLAGIPSMGFWITLFISTVVDALPVFMLLMLLVFGFALIFRILMPNEPAFADLKTAVLSAYYTMMLSHENDYYPPVASVQAVLIVYTFVSAIIMLNIFIAQIGDTYGREKESRDERGLRKRLQLLARMRRSPVQLHKAWRDVWGVGRWVAKCKRSAGGKALTSAQEEVLRKTAEGWGKRSYDGTLTAESLHAKIEREQAEGAGAFSIDVPSLEQTAAWLAPYLRQKAEEAARRDDTEPGYMIVLKAVGASDGEDDGDLKQQIKELKQQNIELKHQMAKQSKETKQQNTETQQQNAELKEEFKQQMKQQNTEMKQQNTELKQQNAELKQQMAQQLSDILAAVAAGRQ